MDHRILKAGIGFTAALFALSLSAADTRKELRLDIANGGSLNVVNNAGSVTLHSGAGRQVIVAYTTHSDKVEVDQSSANKQRLEVRTHVLAGDRPSTDETKVDYDITVPAGTSVTVDTATAPISADGLNGDLALSTDTGQVTVRNVSKSHVRVRSVAGPVVLTDLANAHIDVESSAGAVQLVNVMGPHVTVGTTNGNISYKGDCSGGGDYALTTHSGTIDVLLPENASVDLKARSASGTVENDFPLQAKTHTSFVPKQGRSFAGTSNSGSSSLDLQSFSGKIRVKKQ